jgi:alpha-D-ribose 1-methylphosphonate 5-triphosphate synthase subunit PhnL
MLMVQNLEKRFVSHVLGGKEIVGFRPISFTVPAGKAMGLAGPSGYGKSSVLKCIYRTYLATAGRVIYDSAKRGPVDLTALPENEILALRGKEIGYVTQFLSVLPRVPAVDVVAEPLVIGGLPRAEARAKARELLRRLKIDVRLHDAYPATFSGGEKQRVNLARAVIRPRRVLLLDEPTASLDVEAMRVALDLLFEAKSQGTTMVAIFHDRSIMDSLMDDTYLMPEKELLP